MKNTIQLFLLVILFIISMAGNLTAQSLPRRVYLGIRMENITDDARIIMGIKDKPGVLISEVFLQSTAEKAGFKKGDIITGINDQQPSSTQELLNILSGKKSGDKFTYELLRDKKVKQGNAVFQAFPEESYPDLEVIYTESSSEIGLQRIILTRGKTEGKKPLIVFIGGIGCYSLDSPFDTTRSEIQLLNQLSRQGYICARLEKPGMGDNAKFCKSCQEVSFMEETQGYVNAIDVLKKRNDVDSGAVYIFGHSMGGVFAPLIAQKTTVKGIISYGTIGSGFIEYLAKTRRTIAQAYAFTPIETDRLVRDFCECAAMYFADKMSTADAASKKQICGEYLSIFDLRSRNYNDELYAFNIPELWSRYSGKSLLLWGESDYISSIEDHQIVAQTVNYYHPGNGTFKSIPQADHGMNMAESFQAALNSSGIYNRNVGNEVLLWLNSIN